MFNKLNTILLPKSLRFIRITFFYFSKNEVKIPRSELKKMIRDDDNVVTKQVKSSGPGGQHVNKTQSAVLMKDKQTNISVKVRNSRDSFVNSGIAKKRLVDKLDLFYNGKESKISKKIENLKKQKDRQGRKRNAKNEIENTYLWTLTE